MTGGPTLSIFPREPGSAREKPENLPLRESKITGPVPLDRAREVLDIQHQVVGTMILSYKLLWLIGKGVTNQLNR